MARKYIIHGLLYAAGSLSWIVIFALLRVYCIVDLYLLTDGLWTTKIHSEFVENLTHSIAFHANNFDCDNTYIFTVRYYPDEASEDFEMKSLTSMVDIASWKELESDSISTSYIDNKYRYVLYNTSDGIYMSAFDNE